MKFANQPFVCVLKNDGITVIDIPSAQIFHHAFIKQSVVHGELMNRQEVFRQLQTFLASVKLSGDNGLLVLAREMVFSTSFNSTGTVLNSEIESFMSAVPLSAESMSALVHSSESSTELFVTNSALYQIVMESFFSIQKTITHVLPDSESNNLYDAPWAVNVVNTIQSHEPYNFLQYGQMIQNSPPAAETMSDADPDEQEPAGNHARQYAALALVLTLLAGAVLFLILWTGTIPSDLFP